MLLWHDFYIFISKKYGGFVFFLAKWRKNDTFFSFEQRERNCSFFVRQMRVNIHHLFECLFFTILLWRKNQKNWLWTPRLKLLLRLGCYAATARRDWHADGQNNFGHNVLVHPKFFLYCHALSLPLHLQKKKSCTLKINVNTTYPNTMESI